MSYSMDSEANKKNSETPSPISMENQLVYKFASLEATLSNSLRRLDEKMDRMQTDLHDRHIETTSAMQHLQSSVESRFALKRARIDNLEKEMQRIKHEALQAAEAKAQVVKNEANSRLDEICDKQDKLEKWQTVMVARISAIGGSVILLWTVFGPTFQRFIGNI